VIHIVKDRRLLEKAQHDTCQFRTKPAIIY
jgi:hypothetical protein